MLWLLSLRSALGAALTFISKPPGIYIAAAGAACLALWWFGHLKYAAGVAATTAAVAARAAQLRAKQNEAISQANAGALIRAIEAAKEDAKLKEAVNDVREAAKNMPDSGGIAITADVADRLRSLR